MKDHNYSSRKKISDGYKTKVICFLDILGISNFIEENANNTDKICEIYRIVQRALDTDFAHLDWIGAGYFRNKVDISSLSDSIIISFSLEDIGIILPYVCRLISVTQLMFLSHSVPLRGYITVGKLYHNNESSLIFGQGLVKAYKFERDCIKSPRVILDNSLYKRFSEYSESDLKKYFYKLSKEGYQIDINSFFDQMREKGVFMSRNTNEVLLSHKTILDTTLCNDVWHGVLYDNLQDKTSVRIMKWLQ